MDFSRLQYLHHELNSTAKASDFPSTILEIVIPGYSTISQLALRFLGLDIGILVTGWVFVYGCRTAWQHIYALVHAYLQEHYTSSIEIDKDDNLFNDVRDWLAEQKTIKPMNKLKAITDYSKKNEDDVFDERGYYKHKLPVTRYEPIHGTEELYHNGRYFKIIRSIKKGEDGSGRFIPGREVLDVYCYGQSTQPIKDLMVHVKHWKTTQAKPMTSVYRAASGGHWNRQSTRPSRPLSTVSLNQKDKSGVLDDINEYLHPATARWYAARGIPHRRGYLFYGPPGTGKTSFSFALAGVFGLRIYCLSLNDKELTESDLSQLFNYLPDRCIVLLEDVDSAGLKRAEEESTPAESAEKKDDSSTASNEEAEEEKPKKRSKAKKSTCSISLSALLNVIDGAAAHEGHVLIMTTNTPESLDAALIRPGRVDVQVGFLLATREQIRETFIRMYSITPEEQAFKGRLAKKSRQPSITDPETLEDLAKRFADQLPEDTLSPAELQGYLLKRKNEPQKALDDVAKWRDEVMEAKKNGKKLVGAQ
ncbi:unnamed protein product [Periconia digitata]|uniref:P-loop containing nucleoside triphosphate hydrolase protein n=1 Tax=Periconia digitata TaxID=1303443 RepID=A0A9W4UEI7_9PLEO|nr:unnamed protein product [Periconia digitata]